MSKKENGSGENQETRNFIEKYWQKALIVAGAAGAIGAGVWLTARYLRESKKREGDEIEALKQVENEIEASSDGVVALLETGPYLTEIVGDEAKRALIDLASQIDNEQAQEALELLKEVIETNRK